MGTKEWYRGLTVKGIGAADTAPHEAHLATNQQPLLPTRPVCNDVNHLRPMLAKSLYMNDADTDRESTQGSSTMLLGTAFAY